MFGLSTVKFVLYGLAIAAIAAAAWYVVDRIRVSYQAELERDQARQQHADYRELVEVTAARAAAKMERDGQRDRELTSELEQLEAETEQLRTAAAAPEATVEKADANGNPRLAINPLWWLCQSALLSGNATDAATCKAGSSSAGLRAHQGP